MALSYTVFELFDVE